MKNILFSISLLFVNIVASDEFPLIQPVSVEVAPPPVVKDVPVVAPEPVVVESPDIDNDGVLNESDKCQNTKEDEDVDADGCLIKPDSDNDGIPDDSDDCLSTIEGTVINERGCMLDTDEDGVADADDKCPNTSTDFSVDGYGCPQTATLKVNFAPSKSDVSKELINQLENFALFLKENRGYQVVIYGYTDSLGSKVKNKKLSKDRADAVKDALTRYGISITRLTSIGKGIENPIADNSTREGRALNRRIEVELIK